MMTGGATGTVLRAGAELYVSRATVSRTLVGSGAAFVMASGTAYDTVVESGGQLTLGGAGQ